MDKFDEIWKNRFNDSNLPQDDWNMPDDDRIWQAITPHIQVQSAWKKYLGLWLGLSMLIFGLFALYNWPEYAASNPENLALEKGTSNSIILEDQVSPASINNDSTKLVVKEIRGTQQFSEANSVTTHKASLKRKYVGKTSPKHRKELSIGSNKLFNRNLHSPESWELEAALSASVIRTAFSKPGILKAWNSASKLPKVPLLEAAILQSNSTETITIASEASEAKKAKSSIAIGLNVGVVSWEPKINESYLSELGPAEFYYNSDFGWLANLSVRIPLSEHWNIQTGIQFEQIQSFSGHNSSLNYNTAIEENETNAYFQSLATPYGLAAANFQFNRIQELNTTAVDLLVDIDSRHLIRNWSIPLSISYELPTNMKTLQPTFYLGMGVNYLSNISNNIEAVNTHHDSILFDDSGPTDYAETDINRWHYDARVGIGLEYTITPTVHLNFNYNWLKGLSPVYQKNTHETIINRHQLSFGLIKQLRKN